MKSVIAILLSIPMVFGTSATSSTTSAKTETAIETACSVKNLKFVSVEIAKAEAAGVIKLNSDKGQACTGGACLFDAGDIPSACGGKLLTEVDFVDGLDASKINTAFFTDPVGKRVFDGVNVVFADAPTEAKINALKTGLTKKLILTVNKGNKSYLKDVITKKDDISHIFIKVATAEAAATEAVLDGWKGSYSILKDDGNQDVTDSAAYKANLVQDKSGYAYTHNFNAPVVFSNTFDKCL